MGRVFGLLNVVAGLVGYNCRGILVYCISFGSKGMGLAIGYKDMLLVLNIAWIALSIWLAAAGVGLLLEKEWGRCGSILYAFLAIVLAATELAAGLVAAQLGWITVPEKLVRAYSISGVGGTVFGWWFMPAAIVYAVLLIIFLRKVPCIDTVASIQGIRSR